MVLQEIGKGVMSALERMKSATIVDDRVSRECLLEIQRVLLQANVDVKISTRLFNNIESEVSHAAAGHNKRLVIERAVFTQLCSMFDSGVASPYSPERGKSNLVMFVGLQGSGKTTTCTKYANYYRKRGFRPALVCADTFRDGAFDQLKQNATKARIPFYGSYEEKDPVKVALTGVRILKESGHDLIIVDTSGRHKQDEVLFEEMRQLVSVLAPNLVIFVLDGSIGQAAFDQASAFKQNAPVGACIVTKLDGSNKGGAALTSVVATKSPVIFIGTGEHVEDIEAFESKAFVGKLLGRGDLVGLMDKVNESITSQDDLVKRITSGEGVSVRIVCEMMQTMGGEGVIEMLPAQLLNSLPLNPKDWASKNRVLLQITKSMTKQELDSPNLEVFSSSNRKSRVQRIARGSGRSVEDVSQLLDVCRKMQSCLAKLGHRGIKKSAQVDRQGFLRLAKSVPPDFVVTGCGCGRSFQTNFESVTIEDKVRQKTLKTLEAVATNEVEYNEWCCC